MTLLIKSAFVVNPENETTMKKDVLINNGIIFKIADEISYEADDIINAEGFYLAPGFCDIHVHFRDPGYTYKEDIISGGEADLLRLHVCLTHCRLLIAPIQFHILKKKLIWLQLRFIRLLR